METTASLNAIATKRRRGRPRRRPLRGELLINAARIALAEMVNLSPKTHPINVSTLSKRIGVTRQAIYNNDLVDQINKRSELQRQNYCEASEITALRRPLEDRLASLDQENEELRNKLDGWIQRWVEVEYNAKMHGYDADLLFAPMPLPLRKTLGFRGRKKKT